MVEEYIQKIYEELLKEEQNSAKRISDLQIHLKETQAMIHLLEETNDPNYESFTPRKVNSRNKQKIDELHAEMKELEEAIQQETDYHTQQMEKVEEAAKVLRQAKADVACRCDRNTLEEERYHTSLLETQERTGNVDIVTLAMNLYSHGVDPQLDFSNLPEIREKYETFTRMKVGERQPYAGDLVFSAFSGSHQDAISKGMAWREEKKLDKWTVPYLPIDPKDVGRTYEADVIRINSQSGKGGVAYILKQSFGINVPQQMREQVGYMVKQVSDEEHKELSPEWVHSIFTDNYVDFHPYFTIPECHFKQVNGIFAEAVILHNDSTRKVDANGNGRLDAVSNIIKQYFDISFELTVYEEHALSHGSSSKAMAYVGITVDGSMFWGAGVDEDIIKASIGALVVAVNHYLATKADSHVKDERYIAMLNFIQANYKTVSLADMAAQFNLTEPYISKYIKEKSGKTFGELVTNAKMKKARTLLRNSITTVENIAIEAGYQNVEHFNRQFKKLYGMTPLEYRNSSTK